MFLAVIAYALFPSFNFIEIQDGTTKNSKGHEQEEIVDKSRRSPTFGMDPFCLIEEHQIVSDYWMQNNFNLNGTPSHVVQSNYGATKLSGKQCGFSTESLVLLSKYVKGFEKPRDENLTDMRKSSNKKSQKMSTEEIIRVAGERYIEFSTHMENGYSMFIHPYGSSLSSLSIEETRDVELVHLLLAAAEKVGYKQFDFATRLLAYCEGMASDSGNPVKRVVFYFAESLKERILRETGSKATVRENEQIKYTTAPNLALLACHQELPFPQAMQFAGIEAIIDNVRMANKVHLIDLEIRSGVQWTAVIQALAELDNNRVHLIKLTAIGTTNRRKIEETGKRLTSFAESLNLSFSFQVIFLSDMKEVEEELFNLESDEAVAVYAPWILRSMISRPDCLENLIRVIRRLKPSIVVAAEVEASLNSPSFVNRFVEALFYYSTMFDCLEDCMERDNKFRKATEGIHFREEIRNMVAKEGEERTVRSVEINVWRKFFGRFRMVEIGFSESSWYQANLVLQKFSCGSCCNLTKNGKSIIVGWKGTPIHSLSAWKFR